MSNEPSPAPERTADGVEFIEEPERRQAIARYQELVGCKYLRGLTDVEQEEMDALGRQIDGFYEAFYEPILEDLRTRLKRRPAGT